MDWELILNELSPGQRLRMERDLTDLLQTELLPSGWVVHGALVDRQLITAERRDPWVTAILKFSRARPRVPDAPDEPRAPQQD